MTGQKFIPRADHVGSLLRPDSVKAARKRHFEEGNLSAADLTKIEDEAIIDLVKMQESVGMPVVTDGEARRSFWHYDYMGGLTGLDLEEREEGVQFAGMKLRPIFPTINGPVDFPDDHPMLDHYRYLASVASVRPKISIPGPSCCHFRTALDDIRHTPYRDDVEHLMDDIIKTYQKAVQAFYAFPKWGLPLIRKSLDEGGIGIEPWRAVMLLGMIGEQKDISRILGIIQNNPQLPRPEVWEGAMERLYWKYRIPPKTELEIIELNMKKSRNTELKKAYQLSAASIEFQLQNPSKQNLLVQPHFDFWIGKPEAPPAKRWVGWLLKSPAVCAVSTSRSLLHMSIPVITLL